MFKKVLRRVLTGLLLFTAAIVIFLLASIGLVDRTPASQSQGYKETFDAVGKLSLASDSGSASKFLIGFSKVNLTPSEPVALAGYGNRKGKKYTSVADSIFVRTIVIDNGSKKIAIVSADLLLIPPKVTMALEQQLPSIGFEIKDVFLGAT